MGDYIAYSIIFLSVICFVWWIASVVTTSKSETELNRIPVLFRLFSAGIFFFSIEGGGVLEKALPNRSREIRRLLQMADVSMEVKEIYGAQILFLFMGGLIGGGVGFALPVDITIKIFLIFIFAVVGMFYPVMFLNGLAKKRTDEILHSLPFAIDLISSSMNAGLDFGAAVRYLLSSGETDVLRKEFGIFLRDVELGKTRTEALMDMEKRVGVTEFTRFVSAVSFGMDSGSSVIEIMRVQAEEMRRVKFAKAEQEASKAPVKMIVPMALFVFPAMFVIIFVPIILKFKDSGLMSFINTAK